MTVHLNRIAPDEPAVPCQGCGTETATYRLETIPDVDDIPPIDVHFGNSCLAALLAHPGRPVIDPAKVGGGKVGRRHPVQSRKAAATVKAGTQQAALLDIVDTATRIGGDSTGITCFDASPRMARAFRLDVYSPNQVATRMGELADMGLVKPLVVDGRKVTRPTTPGNDGQVWIITASGQAECLRLWEAHRAVH